MKLIYNSIKYNTLGLDALLAAVAPDYCLGCGAVGSVLCDVCIVSAGSQPPSRCVSCKKLTDDFKTCPSCRSWLHVKHVYVVSEYDEWHGSIVAALKFKLQRSAAEVMARISARTYTQLAEGYVLVPIPTAANRIRQRGFDHALLLAKQIRSKSASKPEISTALSRYTNVRQLGSTRKDRLQQMKHEFYVSSPDRIQNKKILLIDDVITTGATLAAAASVLRAAGAAEVLALVFAQKEN